MYADAPRPNGDFCKGVRGRQTSSHRPKPSGPTRPFLQPTGMLLCATSCQNWSVKKKKTTLCKPHLVLKGQSADGVRSRRGQFKRITALAEAVWDSIAVVSSWICIGFHLHCKQLGFLICLAFHCALPFWWIYNFAFSWIDVVSGSWCYVL